VAGRLLAGSGHEGAAPPLCPVISSPCVVILRTNENGVRESDAPPSPPPPPRVAGRARACSRRPSLTRSTPSAGACRSGEKASERARAESESEREWESEKIRYAMWQTRSAALSLCTTAHPLYTIISLTHSAPFKRMVPLSLKRQCDRTLHAGRRAARPREGVQQLPRLRAQGVPHRAPRAVSLSATMRSEVSEPRFGRLCGTFQPFAAGREVRKTPNASCTPYSYSVCELTGGARQLFATGGIRVFYRGLAVRRRTVVPRRRPPALHPTPGERCDTECRGAWARVTMDQFRRLALRTEPAAGRAGKRGQGHTRRGDPVRGRPTRTATPFSPPPPPAPVYFISDVVILHTKQPGGCEQCHGFTARCLGVRRAEGPADLAPPQRPVWGCIAGRIARVHDWKKAFSGTQCFREDRCRKLHTHHYSCSRTPIPISVHA
jgi:hypothetical protein